jgi:hypothetical protein
VLGVTKLTNVSSREVPKLNGPSISKEPTSSYKYEIYVMCDYWNKKECSRKYYVQVQTFLRAATVNEQK